MRKRIKEHPFSRESREGYVIRETSQDELYADYIFHYPTFVNKFDERTLSVIKEKSMRTAILGFSFNFQLGVLTVYSGSSVSNRLITELSKITEFQMTLDEITFSPESVTKKFRKANLQFNISSLRIKNFSFSEHVVGTYSARIGSPLVAKQLIEEHLGDISYFGGFVEFRGEKANLGFHSNGTLKIYGDQDDISDIEERVKNVLFEEDK